MVNLTYNYTLFGVSFPIFCRFPRKSGEIAFFCRFLKTPGEISALGTFVVESQSETPTPPLWLEYRGVYPYIKYKKKKKKKENKIKKKKNKKRDRSRASNQSESVTTLFCLYSLQLFGDYFAFCIDKIAEVIIRRTALVVDF